MKTLIALLRKIESEVPVVWDRWTASEDETPFYCVYGWIGRKDGTRDFLLIQMWDNDRMEDAFYVTSSAKYSALICELITGQVSDHNPCREIESLFVENLFGKGY